MRGNLTPSEVSQRERRKKERFLINLRRQHRRETIIEQFERQGKPRGVDLALDKVRKWMPPEFTPEGRKKAEELRFMFRMAQSTQAYYMRWRFGLSARWCPPDKEGRVTPPAGQFPYLSEGTLENTEYLIDIYDDLKYKGRYLESIPGATTEERRRWRNSRKSTSLRQRTKIRQRVLQKIPEIILPSVNLLHHSPIDLKPEIDCDLFLNKYNLDRYYSTHPKLEHLSLGQLCNKGTTFCQLANMMFHLYSLYTNNTSLPGFEDIDIQSVAKPSFSFDPTFIKRFLVQPGIDTRTYPLCNLQEDLLDLPKDQQNDTMMKIAILVCKFSDCLTSYFGEVSSRFKVPIVGKTREFRIYAWPHFLHRFSNIKMTPAMFRFLISYHPYAVSEDLFKRNKFIRKRFTLTEYEHLCSVIECTKEVKGYREKKVKRYNPEKKCYERDSSGKVIYDVTKHPHGRKRERGLFTKIGFELNPEYAKWVRENFKPDLERIGQTREVPPVPAEVNPDILEITNNEALAIFKNYCDDNNNKIFDRDDFREWLLNPDAYNKSTPDSYTIKDFAKLDEIAQDSLTNCYMGYVANLSFS